MGSGINILIVPDSLCVLWMVIILAKFNQKRPLPSSPLWITGFLLIFLEDVAHIFYQMLLPLWLHQLAHAVALNAYFFAGVCFLMTASKRLRILPQSNLYLKICLAVHPLLLTVYAFGLHFKALFLLLTIGGLLASLTAAGYLKRHTWHFVYHLAAWLPAILYSDFGQWRAAAYYSLFALYLSTAIGFFLTLDRGRQGRAVVVTGFSSWALCFLLHPFFRDHATFWGGIVNHLWNMERFFLTCGLLLLTLEDLNALHEHEALHDMLTGLPNRRLFTACIEQTLARARRNGTKLILFYIDLNDFKTVNDTWGHQTGDTLLRQIADRLRSLTRASDQICRIGGDEFFLLVEDIAPQRSLAPSALDAAVAQLIAEMKRRIEDEPYLCSTGADPVKIHASFSVGSVVFPEDAASVDELCRIADLRMYADKKRRGEGIPLYLSAQ